MAMSPRLRVLLLALALLGVVAALVWYLTARYGSQPVQPRPLPQGIEQTTATPTPPSTNTNAPTNAAPTPDASTQSSPAAPTPSPSSSASPSAEASPGARVVPETGALAPQTPAPHADSHRLLVPVAGVRPEQLQDTFTQSRSEGRAHNAIDIPAPRGTPVLAAADGKIIKLFNSKPGGITVYQLDDNNRTVYYYAHLERYADGLAEGRYARRGETIAYVGDTGNAGAGNYHLHFSVSLVSDPKRWWSGTNINPYPLLTQ